MAQRTRQQNWMSAVRHAFALGPGDEPPPVSATDDALLDRIAGSIARRGMIAPAILFLEGVRPLGFLGGQFIRFTAPFLDAVWAPEERARLATLLEGRAGIDALLRRLEELGACGRDFRPSGHPTNFEAEVAPHA